LTDLHKTYIQSIRKPVSINLTTCVSDFYPEVSEADVPVFKQNLEQTHEIFSIAFAELMIQREPKTERYVPLNEDVAITRFQEEN
jgi:hypothetical protein